MHTWKDMSRILDAGMVVVLTLPIEGKHPVGTRLTVKENGLNEIWNCLLLDDNAEGVLVEGPPDDCWDEPCELFKVLENA